VKTETLAVFLVEMLASVDGWFITWWIIWTVSRAMPYWEFETASCWRRSRRTGCLIRLIRLNNWGVGSRRVTRRDLFSRCPSLLHPLPFSRTCVAECVTCRQQLYSSPMIYPWGEPMHPSHAVAKAHCRIFEEA
jgi:hypothetical protein